MTIDKYDMLLDAINQVRKSIDSMTATQNRQIDSCNVRFCKLEKTIFGNGLPGLKAKVYWLIAVVCVLASYHGVNLIGFK